MSKGICVLPPGIKKQFSGTERYTSVNSACIFQTTGQTETKHGWWPVLQKAYVEVGIVQKSRENNITIFPEELKYLFF